MAIKATINNTEKEIEQIKNSDEQDIDYVYSRIGDTEVEGAPPISIKSIGGNLSNYRIYGDTVNGESVGDRTGNLFDINSPLLYNASISRKNVDDTACIFPYGAGGNRRCIFIPVEPNTTYTISCRTAGDKLVIATYNQRYTKAQLDLYTTDNHLISDGEIIFDIQKGYKLYTFTTPATTNMIGIYYQLNISATDIMLNQGSTALPYEPYGYKVPVTVSNGTDTLTTPIYLPEQIRKVGDNAEYIDYVEQKLYKVRKNLLQNTAKSKTINGVTFTVNSDGSVTCNGTASANIFYRIGTAPMCNCTLNGCPPNDNTNSYLLRIIIDETSKVLCTDFGSGANANITIKSRCEIRLASGYTYNNLTFYPMIRKADIEDDTYEPYIKNADLDVALPALSTIKGTNTLSVNTSIQPSNIYIKDNFDYKRIFTATRVIEDGLPLNYKSIEDSDSTLKNYRIYGNTVDGESVGDKTGNLFDEESAKIPGFVDNSGRINTSTVILDGVSTYGYMECSASTSYYLRAFTKKDPSSSSITQRVAFFDGNKDFISRELGASSFSFTTPENCSFIRLSLDDNYQNIVLMKGSTEPTEFIPYGYKVPVTVEGKNLLPNTATSQTINGVTFTVNSDGSVTCNGTADASAPSALYIPFTLPIKLYELSGCPDSGSVSTYRVDIRNNDYSVYKYNGSNVIDNGTGCLFDGGNKQYCIRIAPGYTCNNLTFYPMIRKANIEDGTYKPYQTPITTPIYLPEQIRKVGDEAEYIDYGEQKQHRVRKNILQNTATSQTKNGVTFTVNSDGSVTCNGTASDAAWFVLNKSFDIYAPDGRIASIGNNGSTSTFYMNISYVGNVTSSLNFSKAIHQNVYVQLVIAAGYTCNNLTFYPMVRKASIEDDTYEPYIADTELDVTLPTLPTLSGTNTLTVGTEIEPSNIYIKGKIKSLD